MAKDDAYAGVFTTGNLAEADLVKGLLLANGVEARIEGEGISAMLDGMVRGTGIVVKVPADSETQAKEIIQAAHDRGEIEPESDDEA